MTDFNYDTRKKREKREAVIELCINLFVSNPEIDLDYAIKRTEAFLERMEEYRTKNNVDMGD
jgi:hypothetical protein